MITRLARNAMRTRFEVVIADRDMSEADRRAAGEAALDEVDRAEALLSAYRPDADLFRINAQAAGAPVRCDARTWAFLAEALRLSNATNGAFDPTVGPLLDLWRVKGGDATVTPPTALQIAGALALVGMARNVVLDADARTVSFVRAGVCLDPGGVGKGWAIDRARESLQEESGVRSALLHGGTSTVCAVGTAPTGEAWTVGVAHPRKPDALLARAVLANGLSLSVSALHGQTVSDTRTGASYGHVLDPRTGYPVASSDTLLAVVVAPSATVTDAVSTALLVLGEAGLDHLARAFPEATGFLVVVAEPLSASGLRLVSRGDVWQ